MMCPMKKVLIYRFPLLLLPLLSGCTTLDEKLPELSMPEISMPDLSLPELSVPGIYRADIHQGNIIGQKMVDQLKPGMSKRQVRYIMGSPLINDPLHQERWDYFYSIKKDGELEEQHRIALFFEQEKLVKIEGDLIPQQQPAATVEVGEVVAQ